MPSYDSKTTSTSSAPVASPTAVQSAAPDLQDSVGNQALLELLNSSTLHTVVPGDTLSSIASTALGDAESWADIYAVNRQVIGDNPNLIYPGQVLLVPGGESSSTGTDAQGVSASPGTSGNAALSDPSGAPPPDALQPDSSTQAGLSPHGQPVCFDSGSSPTQTVPQPSLRPAEQAFQEAKAEGRSDFGALFSALIQEPGDTARLFGEAFVEDELRSFVAGMDLANQVASYSPNKEVQTMVTFVTQPLANLVDMYAGMVVGDSDRVEQAMRDTVVETVTDVAVGEVTDSLGIKTSDGRVSPWLVNSSGGVSDAGLDVVTNNIGVDLVVDGLHDAAVGITDMVKGWFAGKK